MKPRAGQKTKGRRGGPADLRPLEQRHSQRDAQLQLLLSELVLLLLPSGITPSHFAELAKRAFVNAAGQISRFRNGRFNQSRIAVITGLHRSEVKRLLREKGTYATSNSGLARTERVISGWVSDPRFLDRSGKPRQLPINGRRNSFASLVSAFAGDVPSRAVLDELKRSQSVVQTHNTLRLNTRPAVPGGRLSQSLSQVLPALLDAIHLAAHGQATRGMIPMYRLTLAAKDSVELAILRDRLAGGASSLINGFRDSLKRTPIRSARPKFASHTITITAFVRERTRSKKAIVKS